MLFSILFSLAVIVVVGVAFWTWYRRKVAAMAPDTGVRPLKGSRLTAERLRRLPTPPWRVVFEVGESTLGNVDHVIIGSGGVVAIETVVGDRPTPADWQQQVEAARPQLTVNAATARNEIDELLSSGASCTVLARVYWGAPSDDQPASFEILPGLVAVEGQRVEQWLMNLAPGALTAAQVDLSWQQILMGIGRPDPLS